MVKALIKSENRFKLLQALFAIAKEHYISNSLLREEIVPSITKKRLSTCTNSEIIRVIKHIRERTGNRFIPKLQKHYEPSKNGLIIELEDIARSRWGETFEKSLNKFINSNNTDNSLRHYKFLGVSGLKAIKNRIKEMNEREKNGTKIANNQL